MYPPVILSFLTFCLIVNLSPRIAMLTGTVETLSFSGGNLTTALGLIGVISTLVILVVVYRRYWNSPFIK
jgi:hypothetical protein